MVQVERPQARTWSQADLETPRTAANTIIPARMSSVVVSVTMQAVTTAMQGSTRSAADRTTMRAAMRSTPVSIRSPVEARTAPRVRPHYYPVGIRSAEACIIVLLHTAQQEDIIRSPEDRTTLPTEALLRSLEESATLPGGMVRRS